MGTAIQFGNGSIMSGENTIITSMSPTQTPLGKDLHMIEKTDCRKKVFLIHGHNEAKWRELQSVLVKMGVEPIELSEQTINGVTIIEKFEQVASQCDFAFALFTYDDIVSANGEEYLQVRPNVIFELGWFYARLGREKVMIIEEKNSKGNVFSDLAGIYRFSFHDQIRELYVDIQEVLENTKII